MPLLCIVPLADIARPGLRCHLSPYRLLLMQEMLERLEADGLTLVIITNGHHEIQRDKLARCNADSAIRHVLVGGDEVCIKHSLRSLQILAIIVRVLSP